MERIASSLRACVALASRSLVLVLVGLIGVYQRLVSPALRPCCRFSPSCSAYAVESLRRHGVVRGGLRAAWRLCRCHPFAEGGYDPP